MSNRIRRCSSSPVALGYRPRACGRRGPGPGCRAGGRRPGVHDLAERALQPLRMRPLLPAAERSGARCARSRPRKRPCRNRRARSCRSRACRGTAPQPPAASVGPPPPPAAPKLPPPLDRARRAVRPHPPPSASPCEADKPVISTGVAAIVNDYVISDYDLNQRVALFIATSGVRPTPETLAQIRAAGAALGRRRGPAASGSRAPQDRGVEGRGRQGAPEHRQRQQDPGRTDPHAP